MLDIAAAREGFKGKTIYDIVFVRSSKSLGDGLTKQMSHSTLRELFNSGVLSIQPENSFVNRQ